MDFKIEKKLPLIDRFFISPLLNRNTKLKIEK